VKKRKNHFVILALMQDIVTKSNCMCCTLY